MYVTHLPRSDGRARMLPVSWKARRRAIPFRVITEAPH